MSEPWVRIPAPSPSKDVNLTVSLNHLRLDLITGNQGYVWSLVKSQASTGQEGHGGMAAGHTLQRRSYVGEWNSHALELLGDFGDSNFIIVS